MTQDPIEFINDWHERAAGVKNAGDTVDGAFFVVDWGWPEVEVFTHDWDPEREDWERVGNPVEFGPRYGRTLLGALQVAAHHAERTLKEQGRWPEGGDES